jgi:hypothetical protein
MNGNACFDPDPDPEPDPETLAIEVIEVGSALE